MNLERIADLYLNGPEADPFPWQLLSDMTRATAYAIRATTTVEAVAYEPYTTADQQALDLARGNFLVSNLHCEHPVWSPAENINYRIWHDVIGHGAGLPGQTVAPFNLDGELLAWRRQRAHLATLHLTDTFLESAAFTETIGQFAVAHVTGDFPPARLVHIPASERF